MAAFIFAHSQIFKLPQLLHFSTDVNETCIKIHGLLRSFISNIVIIRIAVSFKCGCYTEYCSAYDYIETNQCKQLNKLLSNMVDIDSAVWQLNWNRDTKRKK